MFDDFFSWTFPPEIISSLIVMVIVALLSVIIGIRAHFHNPLKKPKGLLLIGEMGVEFFDSFTKNMIGSRLPGMGGFIMAIAIYLFISFIFGLTGLPSPVTNMAVPLSLGLISFLSIHIISIRFTKWRYFKRYIEPFPVFLPVNLLSMWAPLLSLTLRLFGNAVAGFTLMSIIYYALENLSTTIFGGLIATEWSGIFIAPIVTPILHAYFDLFSGFIQTTIFISLTTIFVGQEIPDEDEIQSSDIKLIREGGKQ
ncbi:MAG TPA: FoF1 ATP synthase subunit a [Bacilli bacterium]|nr:FoF1 ATP synthase subunit a [Bacilli bacterium]HPS18649.1 FoF1 ATP synthase subunit a [Bacilli bacterium]